MWLMGILTLVAIPLMLCYRNHNELNTGKMNYSLNQFALGNIGGAQTLCAITAFQVELETPTAL